MNHSYKTCLLLFSPFVSFRRCIGSQIQPPWRKSAHLISTLAPDLPMNALHQALLSPLTSYLIQIRSTLRPPCRSQFTHYFCDFLRPYLFQLRAPRVALSSRTALTSESLASLRESFFSRDTCSRIFAYGSAVGAAQAFRDLREVLRHR